MQHVKEHRAPVRYSITPAEAASLGEKMKRMGVITDVQIRKHAKAMGCSTKPIYALVERIGLSVTMRESTPSKKPLSPKRSAREQAEALFSKTSQRLHDGAPPDPDELPIGGRNENRSESIGAQDSIEFDAAVELLASEERRIVELKRSHDEELARREAEFEARVADIEARLRAEEERAREEIRRTAQLRRETRGDRELIEDLRGEISSLKRDNAALRREAERARSVALEHKRVVLDSIQRERQLLQALSQSEADLARCRKRSQDDQASGS